MKQPLAMIVTQSPYRQRSARTQLDVALAAATLELPLELYFIGDGVWQLSSERKPEAVGLPKGLRGWAALAGMTRVAFFADALQLENMNRLGSDTIVDVESLSLEEMSGRWRHCSRVMHL